MPYPAEYRYNEFGDLTNLITFRGGSGWAGSSWPNPDYTTGDNTYWAYDPASGALLSKTDAQGRSVTYTYEPTAGRLLTRTWARGVAVTNSYNDFGDLTEQDYNDGTPSVQFNNYSRAGQPREIVDGAGTNELVYDIASRLVSSTYISGPLTGITVSNHFNPDFGRDKLQVSLAGGWNLEDDYGYDNYGRLGGVTNGNCVATYGYVPNSDLLQNTSFWNGSSQVMTTTRSWNYGFQLASIGNYVNGAPVTSDAYQYDSVNRRTEGTLEDGSSWQYDYNDRNELTGANRYWHDSTPVSGQQFGYGYDNIGNRTWAQFGGDTNGANLRTISYTANSLNQYTGIVTPGLKDIIGAALVTNSVTVNGGVADRHGEYFHRQVGIANTNQPVWQMVTNISGALTNKGGLAFPANNQTFVYDADGNLISDGVWLYQWDGENRLVAMWMTNSITGMSANTQGLVTNQTRLDSTYDYLGRRIQKMVSIWNNTASMYQPSTTNYFVYDGWNLECTLNPQLAVLQSFVWGNDLSGTITKAGGIGGLLMACVSETNCFVAYDGNGNITGLVDPGDGSVAARYEYSSFGELIRSSGELSKYNPFQFSTKYGDDESGLIYFGYRYYSPRMGKWISRDPLLEKGGINLQAFVENNPLTKHDSLGMTDLQQEEEVTGIQAEEAAEGGGAALSLLQSVRAMAAASNSFQRLAAVILGSGMAQNDQEEYDMMESYLAEGNAIISQALQKGQQITTVIGRWKDTQQFITDGKINDWGKLWQSFGHNILSLAESCPKGAAQFSANMQWLAQAVVRGDSIYVGTEAGNVGGASYPLELQFLEILGYVRQGNYMVK